jgi:uncharacterized DUF497 family protein
MTFFDWDEANIAHIAAHDVLPHEAEEVIENQPLYLDYSVEDGEERYREIGETSTGRVLMILSTLRNERTRVITAFAPTRSLLLRYLAFRESEQHGKANHS